MGDTAVPDGPRAQPETGESAAAGVPAQSREQRRGPAEQGHATLSAVAALLAPPTLIAALYGMSFKNIPLVQWQYGWLAIGIGIVVIDVVISVMFTRRRRL